LLVYASVSLANNGSQGQPAPKQASLVAAGQTMKLKGRINSRGADTITIRDEKGVDTVVLLTDNTSVKSKGSGLFHRGKNFEATSLLRGLPVEVEGAGNTEGQLVAQKIRFNESDLKTAMTVESRVAPVEEATKQMSGQIEEMSAVAMGARDEAAKANERITGLDDYDVSDMVTVYFPVNRYTLSPQDKQALDTIATKAETMKGYVIEVAGFTDSTGNPDKNFQLSQRRADAVVQYLTVAHNIPPRRMVTPIGYGETRSAAENSTPEGRSKNRRVEVKILTNRGLTSK
jgi:outer membrane protein OmpA-like peptidoglycan-associated protein